ncbi:MAG: aminopeptidase P family protein [Lachnospiraceae bacterium]|nr:aminopeptidase P family protein [Lachnospiraceae bacterium]
MNYKERRERVAEAMGKGSMLILYSGEAVHISADAYQRFEVNRQFFYLTGIRRSNMALVIDTCGVKTEETLFIEPIDPAVERWVGKKMTKDEAQEVSGIEQIRMIDGITNAINMIMTRKLPKKVYFDTYRHGMKDLPDYNLVRANEFIVAYPGVAVENIYPVVAALRMVKSKEEIEVMKKAVDVTREALEHVLQTLKPGMMEYQVQAEFEYKVKAQGADGMAFPTIAGSGSNGTMLHYETNHARCEENTLILLDLGARVEGYNADITRTYPVSGRFTDRQKEIYNVVLKANQEITVMAKPGLTLAELNNHCKKVLAEGLIMLGLIEKEEEVGRYYMHGVSHHLGIDVHDVTVPEKAKLEPGMVITNEPGLYIDEEAIGIRIEDDLLITETGCEVLSKDIIRTAEEIEERMKGR